MVPPRRCNRAAMVVVVVGGWSGWWRWGWWRGAGGGFSLSLCLCISLSSSLPLSLSLSLALSDTLSLSLSLSLSFPLWFFVSLCLNRRPLDILCTFVLLHRFLYTRHAAGLPTPGLQSQWLLHSGCRTAPWRNTGPCRAAVQMDQGPFSERRLHCTAPHRVTYGTRQALQSHTRSPSQGCFCGVSEGGVLPFPCTCS